MKEQIDSIEQALVAGAYRPGPWQRLIAELEKLPREQRRQYAPHISRVSRLLHARHGFPEVPFLPAFIAEIIGFLGALALLDMPGLLPALLGTVLLALTLQPLMKVTRPSQAYATSPEWGMRSHRAIPKESYSSEVRRIRLPA